MINAIDNSQVSDLDLLSATITRQSQNDSDTDETDERVLSLLITSGCGGPPRKIIISSPPQINRNEAKRVPLKSMVGLKAVSPSVSNNVLKQLNSHTGGYKLSGIKFPCVRKFYSDRDATVGRLFESHDMELENSAGDLVTKTVIICNDIPELISNWCPWILEEEDGVIVKLGIDHGQNFLKIDVRWSTSRSFQTLSPTFCLYA